MIKSDTLKTFHSTRSSDKNCHGAQTLQYVRIILVTKLTILFCNYEHRHKLFCVFFQKTRYLPTSSLIYLNIATQGLQTRLKKRRFRPSAQRRYYPST
jgi:hypothetical protein